MWDNNLESRGVDNTQDCVIVCGMESPTITKTVSPKGVRYYLNGKRIGEYVYTQFVGNPNWVLTNYTATIHNGVIRHSSTISKR